MKLAYDDTVELFKDPKRMFKRLRFLLKKKFTVFVYF